MIRGLAKRIALLEHRNGGRVRAFVLTPEMTDAQRAKTIRAAKEHSNAGGAAFTLNVIGNAGDQV